MPCRSSLRALSRTASSFPTHRCPKGPLWRSTSSAGRSMSHRSCRPNSTPGIWRAPRPWSWSNAWPKRAKPMKRGEVWRVRLHSVPGHTQAGIRPAVIVQEDQATASLPTVLIVPFTGTWAALRFPGTLAVQPDGQNGLTVPSVALAFQLTAIDKTDCLQRLGELDPATMDQIL